MQDNPQSEEKEVTRCLNERYRNAHQLYVDITDSSNQHEEHAESPMLIKLADYEYPDWAEDKSFPAGWFPGRYDNEHILRGAKLAEEREDSDPPGQEELVHGSLDERQYWFQSHELWDQEGSIYDVEVDSDPREKAKDPRSGADSYPACYSPCALQASTCQEGSERQSPAYKSHKQGQPPHPQRSEWS